VAAGCRFLDQLLGRLLDLAGPDTFVMVVAPQAALGGAERPGLVEGEGPDFWVRPHGLFCLTGPGIRKDALVYGAQALDVVPTILACRGLPAALDMPGRVLAEAFEQAPGLERVETWEPDAAPRGEPSLAEEAIRALAELGYTDPLAGRQPAQSDAPLHLAWVHLVAGRGASAVELLEPLARSGPPSGMLSVCLAWGYLLCGRLEECRGALDAAPAQGRALVRMVRGLLLFREGRTPEALAALEAVERDDAGQPALLAMAGEIYRGAGRLDEAERCYRAALSRDPDLAAAHLGRAHLLLAWNEAEASAEAALAAVRVRYDLAPAHLVLGMALARMGMAEQAATALETCLKLEPGNRVAREWLSRRARRRKAQ